MRTRLWAILLMVVVTFFTSFAQILYKFGVGSLEFNFFSIITNYYLIFGIGLYIFGAVLLIFALKGGELTVLYPIIALSYILVGLMSSYFFNESLNLFKFIGILLITLGVVSVGVGSKKGESVEYIEGV
jgi:multidrug transporter EmrE-like cation transporter